MEKKKQKNHIVEKIENSENSRGEISTIYRKSNSLINAKGKSSSLGLKLFAIGILMAHPNDDGTITAKVSGQELRELFNKRSGSFYTEIKELIKPAEETKPGILDWRIYIEDQEHERLTGLNVVTSASFENGELELTFNSKLKNHIYGLKGNYGSLSISTTIQLQSPYSIRCYEIFKSFMDRERAVSKNENGPYILEYDLTELKQTLGLIRVVKTKDNEEDKQERLASFSNFKVGVLERVKNELNDISSIHVDYVPIRSGKGGKVTSIRFILNRQDDAQTRARKAAAAKSEAEITNEKFNILSEAAEILKDTDISLIDIKAICDAADFDLEKIKTAYELSKHAGNIESITGWMISAIRKGYKPSASVGSKSNSGKTKSSTAAKKPRKKQTKQETGSRNTFNNFEQNEYDFNELEKRLLNGN